MTHQKNNILPHQQVGARQLGKLKACKSAQSAIQLGYNQMDKMEKTRLDLTLDFTKPRNPWNGQQTPILVTPNFYLSTPEVSKMITTEAELAVLTPTGISSVIPQTNNLLPSPLIPTNINNTNNIISNNYGNYFTRANNSNYNNYSHHYYYNQNCDIKNPSLPDNNINNANSDIKKSMPDNINNTNSDSKQNVRHDNDQVKRDRLEKKRERNRLAARRCRQRKMEIIDELRKEVAQWEQRYRELEMAFEQFKNLRVGEIEALQREIASLRSQQ